LHDPSIHPVEDAPAPAHEPPPAPAGPPRELTSAVRRRAWRERHVRVWLVLGLALLGVTLYYAGSRTWWWWQESRLIRSGLKVQAEIMGPYVGEDWPANKVLGPDAQVDLVYEVNGKKYRPHSALVGRKEQIKTRSLIPIFVNPKDPEQWTPRQSPPWLPGELFATFLLAPAAVLLLVIAWVKRTQVLRIYRDGEAILAEVVGIGQTPSAPLSRLIRCAVDCDDRARLVKTVLPASQKLAPGDLIWLITPPGKPEPAIPAALFE
jgi:hypothetical protein